MATVLQLKSQFSKQRVPSPKRLLDTYPQLDPYVDTSIFVDDHPITTEGTSRGVSAEEKPRDPPKQEENPPVQKVPEVEKTERKKVIVGERMLQNFVNTRIFSAKIAT